MRVARHLPGGVGLVCAAILLAPMGGCIQLEVGATPSRSGSDGESGPARKIYVEFAQEFRVVGAKGTLDYDLGPDAAIEDSCEFGEADLAMPLGIAVDIPWGPRIWADWVTTRMLSESRTMEWPWTGVDAELERLDAGFTPLRYHGPWGCFSLLLGVRWVFLDIDLGVASQTQVGLPESWWYRVARELEGLYPVVGASLDLEVVPGLFAADARVSGGLWTGAGDVTGEAGLTLFPDRAFQLRFGFAHGWAFLAEGGGGESFSARFDTWHYSLDLRFRV